MAAGACSYCGCREDAPCDPPCTWADRAQTTCTTCAGAEAIARKVIEVLGDVVASGRVKLIASAWADLTAEQRQVLVMSCRSAAEMIATTLQESLIAEAVAAEFEIGSIARFLVERLPPDEVEKLGRDASVSDIVIRLLEPHIGSRILLP